MALFNKKIDKYVFYPDIKEVKKKKLRCLMCGKLFLTTPNVRFCPKCRDIKRRIKVYHNLPQCPQTRKH